MYNLKTHLFDFINSFSSENIFNNRCAILGNHNFKNLSLDSDVIIFNIIFTVSYDSKFSSFYHTEFGGTLVREKSTVAFNGSFMRHASLGFILSNKFDLFLSL